jgi:hypothetical protein
MIKKNIFERFFSIFEKCKQQKPHAHVMAAYRGSIETYAALYKKLAE